MIKPRILIIHPSDELYGADRVLIEVVLALRETASVSVWLPTDLDYPDRQLSTRLKELGVDVQFHAIPIMRRSYANLAGVRRIGLQAWRFRRIVRAHAPDLLYCNTTATVLVSRLAAATRAKTVVHVHEDLSSGLNRLVGHFIPRKSTIIAVSEAVKTSLPVRLRDKSEVVYNGFPDPGEWEAEAAPSDRPLRFLLASRWNAWKGHDVVLRAWAEMDPGARGELTILGAKPPVGEYVDVPALVEKLGIASTVRVVGQVDDVRPYLDRTDVVLVPSTKADPLPTIAIEAAGRSKPVIASAIGGLPEIVAQGSSGWIVPAGDVRQWAQAMESVQVSELRHIGQQARAVYIRKFSRAAFHASIRRLAKPARPDFG